MKLIDIVEDIHGGTTRKEDGEKRFEISGGKSLWPFGQI